MSYMLVEMIWADYWYQVVATQKNGDSGNMSLSVWGSISVLAGFGNGGVGESIAINADVSFDDKG